MNTHTNQNVESQSYRKDQKRTCSSRSLAWPYIFIFHYFKNRYFINDLIRYQSFFLVKQTIPISHNMLINNRLLR